jgi:3-oxoacyl-[acyl-carrier-protein] synthase-1
MSEVVLGIGLCTPIGTTAEMTLASMRAGITRFRETDVEDTAGSPVRASPLTTLDPALPRTARMIALGRAALAGIRDELPTSPVGLYLGLPEPGLGAPFNAAALAAVLREDTGGRLELMGAPESGRAAFFEALAAACADLRTGRVGSMALVGAVDSFCDRASLRAIAAARLHLGKQNLDGRIPGEAAGFILLARPGAAGSKGTAMVLGTALGVEPAPFTSREASLSEGLTEVFRALRTDPAASARRVEMLVACQPGESFWGTELTRAYLRNTALMPEPLTIARACESFGDAGAGAAPVMLAAAIARLRRAGGRGKRALVYGSADGGRVGACVVESIAEG